MEQEAELILLRAFVERRWAEEGRTSRGQCLRVTHFLHRVWGAEVRGGWPKEDHRLLNGGFFDGHTWHFHYWVERGGLIIDLTADQFGAEPVILTPLDDPRYRHVARPEQIRQDLADTLMTARRWAAHPALPARQGVLT